LKWARIVVALTVQRRQVMKLEGWSQCRASSMGLGTRIQRQHRKCRRSTRSRRTKAWMSRARSPKL